MQKYYFCTLFDSNYLSRGLALYFSIKENCNNFHLFIFAFDDLTLLILKDMRLENVTVISLEEFEDDELLSVKGDRTRTEYCWTCSSKTIQYVFKTYKPNMVTYLDADLYFYNSPDPIFEELGEDSVLITPHNFPNELKHYEINGKYCVQFMVFKNDFEGNIVLKWWCDKCIEWCYFKNESKRFGDQKYLDYFQDISKKVHDLEHLGALAPWNCNRYSYKFKNKKLMIIGNSRTDELIFNHYHKFQLIRSKKMVLISLHSIPAILKKHFYIKYAQKIFEIEKSILMKYDDLELINDEFDNFKSLSNSHLLYNLFYVNKPFSTGLLLSKAKFTIRKYIYYLLRKILHPKKIDKIKYYVKFLKGNK